MEHSKVTRAELIQKSDGKVVCDLTADDIGTGRERDGDVVWAPDSKRFGYVTADLTPPPGNLFSQPTPPPQRKQTILYQLSGEKFVKGAADFDHLPESNSPADIEGAILGHVFVEPVRWATPETLELSRHDYLETADQRGLIQGHERTYTITVHFKADGSLDVDAKQSGKN